MALKVGRQLERRIAENIAKGSGYEENQRWYNRKIKELRKKYGGSFIAISEKKVIDSSSDFDRLLNAFKKELSEIYIVYVPKEGETTYW